jgi:outer membrane protein OmpA-like peptidoglycan-associated protein
LPRVLRYDLRMRCLILALVTVAAAALPAQGQRFSADEDEEKGVTVNMDALGLPEPAPIPEIPAEGATRPRSKDTSADGARRVVPLPRPKPETGVAATVAVAAPAETPPATPAPEGVARQKPKADLPVAMMENFPVELRGTARDPFPNAKAIDPAAGFRLIGRVRFGDGETMLAPDASGQLDTLAESLGATPARVRIVAYSGRSGDLSSQARRLSLERARAVRDHLVARGIPFERINIMPLGGPPAGETDRVDILVPPG